ncbi:MAG: HEPN domain-containing protein [Candidatus Methanoperedens sp.]|nr:HEPN domain-containing protein [Candidatus Methanoperedens sp.]
MSIDELERSGIIKKLPTDRKKINDSLDLARRDMNIARNVLDENCDWAFSIAYNSILQSVRALMFSKGYRPSSDSGHVSAVRFARLFLKEEDVISFDRMRRKRHTAVYDTVGSISRAEAENALLRAKKFIMEVEMLIKDN